MKYLLFAGDYYYPCGGYKDLKGEFDTLEEALAATKEPGKIYKNPGPIVFAMAIHYASTGQNEELEKLNNTPAPEPEYTEGPPIEKYDWWHIVHGNKVIEKRTGT